MRYEARLVSLAIAVAITASAQQDSQPKYQQGGSTQSSGTQNESTAKGQKSTSGSTQKSARYSYSPQFTGADRDTIRTCMQGTYGDTGIRIRPLPASLDNQVQPNATLSSTLQSRVQPLPDICTSRLLATLPANWTRVLVGTHVVLLAPNNKVADMFDLNGK